MKNVIFVKLGQEASKLRFSHSKVHRAITTYELKRNVETYTDGHVLVVEGVYEEEQRELREYLPRFVANNENKVFFFCEEGSLAYKFATANKYPIVGDLKSLYGELDKIGLKVSTFIEDKKKAQEAFTAESFTDTSFESIVEETSEEITEEPIEEEEANVDTVDIPDELEEALPSIEDISTEDLSIPEEDYVQERSEALADSTDVAALKESLEVTEKEKDALDIELKKHRLLVLQWEKKYKSASEQYQRAVTDIRSANKRITSLEKLLKASKEENELVKQRFNELVVSDEIIEDPISLAEYQAVQDSLEESRLKVGQLKSQLDSTRSLIDSLKDSMALKDSEVADAQKTADYYKKQIADLEAKIKSGELHSKELDELKARSRKQEQTIADKVMEIEQLKDREENLQSNIEDLYERITAESTISSQKNDIVLAVLKRMQQLVNTAKSAEEQRKLMSDELEDCKKQLDEKTSLLTTNSLEYSKMKEKVDSVNTQINIAIADERRAKEALERELSQTKAKLSAVEGQLDSKTAQYDSLIGNLGMDVNGVQALVAENKSLSTTNSTLNTKLSSIIKDKESLERNLRAMQQKAKELEDTNKQMNSSLQAIAGLGGGNGQSAASFVKPIKYRQRGQIISVFGCGSFGITTTAFSIASKLAINDRVLLLDFDMTNPTADVWFGQSPVVKDAERIVGDPSKASGLGVFVEKGIDAFKSLEARLLVEKEKNKGGGLYYMSGLYYTPEPIKLGTANYEALFDRLGQLFNFIVIDFGKLGASELNNQIIKTVSDISSKTVAVTPNDRFKVREMRMKLNELKIPTNRVCWLLNLCKTTSIDDRTKQYLGQSQYGIIPFEAEIYGAKEKFTRSKLTRDRFNYFYGEIIFKKD